MRQRRAGLTATRFAIALATGSLLIGLSATPALALGPPFPPTITGVTRGNASISVAFTQGSNNGSPILSNAATCTTLNDNTSGTNTSVTGSPIVVSGLTNGYSYTCKVTATNALGTSSPSAASASVTPGGLLVPSALVAVTLQVYE